MIKEKENLEVKMNSQVVSIDYDLERMKFVVEYKQNGRFQSKEFDLVILAAPFELSEIKLGKNIET